MSATITVVNSFVQGDRAERSGTLNLGVYATNGIAVTKGQFNLVALKDLDIRPSGGYTFETTALTDAGATIKVWVTGASSGAAQSELANSTDITAITPRFMASGK